MRILEDSGLETQVAAANFNGRKPTASRCSIREEAARRVTGMVLSRRRR